MSAGQVVAVVLTVLVIGAAVAALPVAQWRQAPRTPQRGTFRPREASPASRVATPRL